MARPTRDAVQSRKRLQLVRATPAATEAFTDLPTAVIRRPLKPSPKLLSCILLSYATEQWLEAPLSGLSLG